MDLSLDFISVIKDKKIDFFVNRIECYNPLTKENLIKMSENITQVTRDILPEQKLDCVVKYKQQNLRQNFQHQAQQL